MSDAFDAVSAEDARLLAELGGALGADPLPAGLVGRVERLVDLADLDRDLAKLLDQREPAGIRGPVTDERLTFEVEGGSVAVELVVGRDQVRGQVLAGRPTEVVLERPGGTSMSAVVDEFGRFSFEHVAAGPTRLVLRTSSARPVTTDWFLM